MNVLGLDLSLTSTGYAFVEEGVVTGGGTVKSTGKAKATLEERGNRLAGIVDRVGLLAEDFYPDLVVIEAPSYGSQHGSQHDRSGLWWLVVDRLWAGFGFPCATVSPNGRAKYGTGKGNAGKDAVLAAVIRRYTSDDFEIASNDMADAVILAAMGSRHLGVPVEADLPAENLKAMDGAAWPS